MRPRASTGTAPTASSSSSSTTWTTRFSAIPRTVSFAATRSTPRIWAAGTSPRSRCPDRRPVERALEDASRYLSLGADGRFEQRRPLATRDELQPSDPERIHPSAQRVELGSGRRFGNPDAIEAGDAEIEAGRFEEVLECRRGEDLVHPEATSRVVQPEHR